MKYLLLIAAPIVTEWWLSTINLDTEGAMIHRTPFTSQALCREAGFDSIALAGLFGGRAGFVCTLIKHH